MTDNDIYRTVFVDNELLSAEQRGYYKRHALCLRCSYESVPDVCAHCFCNFTNRCCLFNNKDINFKLKDIVKQRTDMNNYNLDKLIYADDYAYQQMGSGPCEDCEEHKHGRTKCMYWNNLIGNEAADDKDYEPCEESKQYDAQYAKIKNEYHRSCYKGE